MNILFVCSKNQWRSPTAETIFKNRSAISVRSAGTSPTANVKLNQKHMAWAELVFVMEKKHREIIMQKFKTVTTGKKIIVLDIADEYQYMDEELVEELTRKVNAYL